MPYPDTHWEQITIIQMVSVMKLHGDFTDWNETEIQIFEKRRRSWKNTQRWRLKASFITVKGHGPLSFVRSSSRPSQAYVLERTYIYVKSGGHFPREIPNQYYTSSRTRSHPWWNAANCQCLDKLQKSYSLRVGETIQNLYLDAESKASIWSTSFKTQI